MTEPMLLGNHSVAAKKRLAEDDHVSAEYWHLL
jgi:hypothetical protein